LGSQLLQGTQRDDYPVEHHHPVPLDAPMGNLLNTPPKNLHDAALAIDAPMPLNLFGRYGRAAGRHPSHPLTEAMQVHYFLFAVAAAH
jgi:hypothetical protein